MQRRGRGERKVLFLPFSHLSLNSAFCTTGIPKHIFSFFLSSQRKKRFLCRLVHCIRRTVVMHKSTMLFLSPLVIATQTNTGGAPISRYTNFGYLLEHLLRNIPDCEIGYPTETNFEGQYIRHVTSPDHQRRKRRSIDRTDTPVYYNITYRGVTYSLKLRLNEDLLSSGFVVERHKKGGKVETTRLVDNCYLIGETAVYNLSVALSDCDGLVS